MTKFYCISLLLIVCVAFVSAQEVSSSECPTCEDDCVLGRENGTDGCEICSKCIRSGTFESDILVDDPESYLDLVRRYKRIPQARGLQRSEIRKWPKNGDHVTLPFTYESTVSAQKQKNIEAAMAQFENKTCIRFARRTTETSYIYFSGRGGCSSYVGRTGRKQRISIGTGCDRRQGTIIHEIMHALGFWHEQSRGDRDDYINILWNNIRSGASGNFQKQDGDWDPLGSPYDLGSVMHYGGYFFSDGQNPTIVDKNNNPVNAQRVGFSAEDINQINRRYECTDYPTVTTTTAPATTAPTTAAITTQATISTASPKCVDNHASCEVWRDGGYCPVSSYVRDRCVKACTGCEGEGTTTPEETTAIVTTRPATTQEATITTQEAITTEGSCEDRSSSCKYWDEQGYCSGGGYEAYMRRNCMRTCGYCANVTETTTPEPAEKINCEDNHNACEFWAESDFCINESYLNFMKTNCQKSCSDKGLDGFCGISATTTTTAQTTTTTEMTTTEEATTTAIASECVDTSSSCNYWAEQEFCNNSAYTSYMRRNCPEACGYCQN